MTEIADQLALSHAEFEGIVIDSRILIEGYRPGQYMCIQLTHLPCEMIEILIHIIVGGQVSYLLTNVSELSTSVLNLLYSLWVGYDSKLSLSILLTTTPSVCEPECIATLLSMVAVTLPNASFCAFYSLSADTPEFQKLGLLPLVFCWMFIVRPRLLGNSS